MFKRVVLTSSLVASVLLVAASATAAVRSKSVCSRLSVSEVNHALGEHGLTSHAGLTQQSEGVSGASGATASCTYYSQAPLGVYLDLFTLSSGLAASHEFEDEITLADRNGISRTVVTGPWHKAFEFGDDEIYVLKHATILHLQLIQGPHPRRVKVGVVRGLATMVASDL
jgi:hypothetical protein